MGNKSFTDPGTLLATTHAAGGGLRVRLRLTRPSDTPRVRAFLEGLSTESRQRRFFSAMPSLPEAVVRHFSFFRPRERLVVAATVPADGSEEIVGLADVAFLATGLAELAVVVSDERQGHGVGTLLGEAVASLAARHGAVRLKAELLTENGPMQRLMERIGPTMTTVEHGTTVVYARLPAARRRAA